MRRAKTYSKEDGALPDVPHDPIAAAMQARGEASADLKTAI